MSATSNSQGQKTNAKKKTSQLIIYFLKIHRKPADYTSNVKAGVVSKA